MKFRCAVWAMISLTPILVCATPLSVYSVRSKALITDVPEASAYEIQAVEGQWQIVRFTKPTVPVWISSDYVRQEDGLVMVTADRLNVRMQASVDSRILTGVSAGYKSTYLSKRNGFIQIYAPTWLQFAIPVDRSSNDAILPTKTTPQFDLGAIAKEAGMAENSTLNVGSSVEEKRLSGWKTRLPSLTTVQPTKMQSTNKQINVTANSNLRTTDVESTQGNNAIAGDLPNNINDRLIDSTEIVQQHRLAPGDTISLMVFGENDLGVSNVRIPQSGRVSFPLIGSIIVAGRTTKEVEILIRSTLSQGYIKNPRLTLTIDSYRPIFIKGAVQETGAIVYTEGLTVAKVIALAGGAKKSAQENGVSISREGKVIEGNLSIESQYQIESGDIISVDEEFGVSEESAFYVYLHGEVSRPGEYLFRRGLTVEKAVVLAGGFTLRASRKKISVSRIADEGQEPVRLKKVRLYLPVEPGDIIDVGASWF